LPRFATSPPRRVVAGPRPRTYGQAHRELDADRHAFTPSTHTVDDGHSITEPSYASIENRTGPATNSLPALLVRAGVFRGREL